MARAVGMDLEDGVARVTLRSPQTGNALSARTVQDLWTALSCPEVQSSRVLVLSAEGEAFCRGMQLDGMEDERAKFTAAGEIFARCLLTLATMPQPVICCVQGPAMGGGVALAVACDIILGTSRATFSMPEPIMGMIPALAAPFLLRRLMPGHCRRLMLSGGTIAAAEAMNVGLIDEVTDDLPRQTDTYLRRFTRMSPAALGETKRYLNSLVNDELHARVAEALNLASEWMQRPDVRAGIVAFTEGGLPSWFSSVGRNAVATDSH